VDQLNEREFHQHVTLLGWLHILGNAILLVLGACTFTLLAGIGVASGDPVAARILSVVGLACGSLLVVLAIPGIVAGYGLLRRQSWARILAMVVGFLGLINFPVGTAIGLYTFWVLLQEKAAEYFISPVNQSSANMTGGRGMRDGHATELQTKR
jgi:hypothetical protein